ncbi:MAG: amino acid adenylation domain protein [Clostridiales bacterium]|nr:amino acid adenylation domain protein [Clostridiales bacterium]
MRTLRDILINLKDKVDDGITIVKGYNDKSFISYKELYTQSSLRLNQLIRLGVHPKQELIIIFEDLESFIYLFWACILGGIIPLPVSSELNNTEKITNILSYCANPFVFCNKKSVVEELQKSLPIDIVLSYEELDKLEHYNDEMQTFEYSGDENDIAFIQFSSGSTSTPKGVKLTNSNILGNIRSILKQRNVTGEDKFLSWLPLTHNMGIIFYHITPMFLGSSHMLMPTSTFILHPLLWMQIASEYKITVTGSSNFGINYLLSRLSSTEEVDWNLVHLKHIMLGAEKISIDLCNNFISKLRKSNLKRSVISPGYGLAEATLCVTLTRDNSLYNALILDRNYLSIGDEVRLTDESNSSNTKITSVGQALENISIGVVDQEKNILQEGFIGIILVKGSSVTSGYYNNSKLTDEVIDKDGWLNTGDIGFIYNNELYITGRYKDVISYNGKSYFSNDLEEFIVKRELAEWNEVIVVGLRSNDSQVNDYLVCFLKYGNKDLGEFCERAIEIRKMISAYIGVTIDDFVPVDEIPKTASGKVKRYDLKNRYINKEWSNIISKIKLLCEKEEQKLESQQYKEENAIERLIANCFEDILGINVDLDENLADYSLNSLSIVKIYEQINQIFPQLISVADLYEYSTVNLLSDYIRERQCI